MSVVSARLKHCHSVSDSVHNGAWSSKSALTHALKVPEQHCYRPLLDQLLGPLAKGRQHLRTIPSFGRSGTTSPRDYPMDNLVPLGHRPTECGFAPSSWAFSRRANCIVLYRFVEFRPQDGPEDRRVGLRLPCCPRASSRSSIS